MANHVFNEVELMIPTEAATDIISKYFTGNVLDFNKVRPIPTVEEIYNERKFAICRYSDPVAERKEMEVLENMFQRNPDGLVAAWLDLNWTTHSPAISGSYSVTPVPNTKGYVILNITFETEWTSAASIVRELKYEVEAHAIHGYCFYTWEDPSNNERGGFYTGEKGSSDKHW